MKRSFAVNWPSFLPASCPAATEISTKTTCLSEHSLIRWLIVARATPLPPDERRAAIITATAPLLRERGRDVSTREIAEAAGIAEGTIFRVFTSKEELIDAVIDDALDPTTSYLALQAIDLRLDLELRVARAVAILQDRLHRVFGLVYALGFRQPPGREDRRRKPPLDRERETSTLAAVLAPDADRLRVPPDQAATMLSALVFALNHPLMHAPSADSPSGNGRQLDPWEVADIFLHGITTASTFDERVGVDAITADREGT